MASHPTMMELSRRIPQFLAGAIRFSPRRWLEHHLPRACAWVAVTVYGWTGDRRNWLPLLARVSAHVTIILVTLMAARLSGVEWPAQATSTIQAGRAIPAAHVSALNATAADPTPARWSGQNRGTGGQLPLVNLSAASRVVTRSAQPHTVIPDRPRLGVITYTVQPGDNVQAIAALFGLEPTTIMWADPAIEEAPDLLRIGQVVTILPIDGVYHKVAAGDTLESIAKKYKVEASAIVACEYNHLESPDAPLIEGTYLIVPGGEKPYVPKVVTTYTGNAPVGASGTGRFQWPALGSISQGYWYGHRAIDIAGATGNAILAGDGGFVSFAGWTDIGYGYLIVLDHANGFVTYYAHLSAIYVSAGQAVERGQVIGAMGSTGRSTGPHLHFEIRYYDVQHNPLAYLP